jgi:fatty-acyl-CoA synthase
MARSHTARTALVLAIVGALALAFAGFGVHEEMFPLDYAVRTLATGWAPGLAGLGVILGGLALIAAVLVPPRRDIVTSLLALAIGAGVLAGSAQVRARAAANPPIHDVATDWSDPLLFGPAMLATRGADANPVVADAKVQPQPQNPNLTGTPIAQVNAVTCRGAAPLVLTASPQAAYDKARAAILREGMALVTENPAAGRLEASWITKWLKLKGDLLVRVKPEGAGARIDIRSVSRSGIADLGENCRRVTRLRADIAR